MNYPYETPLVSVIVAAYNEERFIGRCLRSLLQQSQFKRNYEIIVINDGSTDRTAYALSLFTDPSNSIVKVITNERNIGLPASLNRGITVARAKYIVRVDADDFVNTNFLNFLFYYLECNFHAKAVACDYLLLDDKELVLDRCSCDEKPIACGIMFRKEELFEIGLYDEDFLCHEESELRIRFEKKYMIHRLAVSLYRYRMHDSNITSDVEKMEHHRLKLLAKHDKNAIT